MPKKLEEFLVSLDNDEADALWAYLDGDPEAIHKMIEIIIDYHPLLR